MAVGSKTGNLFLLDRETGKRIFGVEERPVPQSDVPGEILPENRIVAEARSIHATSFISAK